MCKYCDYINKTLDLGYKISKKKIVTEIAYEGFYWGKKVEIPLNYCPNCGKKIKNIIS